MDSKRKYVIFSIILILVVVVTIITTIGSEPCKEPGKWNTTGNDTEDLSAAAIGRYAPRRYKYGYDQNGKIRPRW